MLLNMVMFKVTICDFGKMNINMTDKIEKKESGELCIHTTRTETLYMWTRAVWWPTDIGTTASVSASSSGTRRTVCFQWTTTVSCPTIGMTLMVSARSRPPARAIRSMSTESSPAARPTQRSSRFTSVLTLSPIRANYLI